MMSVAQNYAPLPAWVTSLTYSSRATAPMTATDLEELEESARARNHREAITGVMIYDEGRIVQSLEGPLESIARLWDAVRRDSRHTDIEILRVNESPMRRFAAWDMKLIRREHGADVEPLAKVSQLVLEGMSGVLDSVILPALAARHRGPISPPRVDPRVAELAHLLIATEPAGAAELVRELHAHAGSLSISSGSIFEPAARSLGELWYADDCSGFELTLGLCRLQASVREIRDALGSVVTLRAPRVLVATQPGEIHMLGTALDSTLLGEAGWEAEVAFPATDAALEAVLAATWFDALDLSVSTALTREELLLQMPMTIAGARTASLNPGLVVVAGGRSFFEEGQAASRVGADRLAVSARDVAELIERALRTPRLLSAWGK